MGVPVDRTIPKIPQRQCLLGGILAALVALTGTTSAARGDAPTEDPRPDLRAASEAYERGRGAFVDHRYDEAARWFETAYRLVPSSSALLQAVKAHQLAGARGRAATLAAELERRFPEDEQAARFAARLREDAQRHLLRVEVGCDGCELRIDGRPVDARQLFLEPGRPHEVVAAFRDGRVEEHVEGAAGETVRLELKPPAPAELAADSAGRPDDGSTSRPRTPDTASARAPEAPSDESDGGLPPYVTYIGIGATALSLGLTIWSGVDTLQAALQYEDMPTEQRLDAGLDKARRTHIGIGLTTLLGLATLAVGVWGTDWAQAKAQSGRRVQLQPGFGLSTRGGTIGLTGRY
jgi:hypothetical protein